MNRANLKRPSEPPELELILCPRQPGNLKITSWACARRYEMARENAGKKGHSDLAIALEFSLGLCRGCPQGRANWRRHRAQLDQKRR